MTIIKVSGQSRTAAVAGAIAGMIRDEQRAEVQAIGAGAVNQAVKATIIARRYLADEDVEIKCIPSYVDVLINDQKRTAVCLIVEPDLSQKV